MAERPLTLMPGDRIKFMFHGKVRSDLVADAEYRSTGREISVHVRTAFGYDVTFGPDVAARLISVEPVEASPSIDVVYARDESSMFATFKAEHPEVLDYPWFMLEMPKEMGHLKVRVFGLPSDVASAMVNRPLGFTRLALQEYVRRRR